MTSIRSIRLVLATAAVLLTAGSLSAQSKVGIVNLQKALQDTAEIKKAETDLKARYGPKQDELASLEKEIARMQQDGETNQSKYTPAALQELSNQIQIKQRQLQRNSQALQEDVNRERQDILNRVGTRLQDIVKKVAEEKGLDVVVDAQSTLYFKPVADISTDVTAAYDKAYPPKP